MTCLYRGLPAALWDHDWKRLASAQILRQGCWLRGNSKVEFALAWVRRLPFGRAIWRELAGFDAFVDFLADDYELGQRIAELGLHVKLSDVVVETFLPAYDVAAFLGHQLRWARTVRDAQAMGYIGLVLPLECRGRCSVIAWRRAWSWLVLDATVFLRFGWRLPLAAQCLEIDDCWIFRLLPVRDLIAVGCVVARVLREYGFLAGKTVPVKEGPVDSVVRKG